MATEDFVQLPPDSSGSKVRMLDVDPGDTGSTVLQEVVALADGDGNLLTSEGKLAVSNSDVLQQIKFLSRGIAHLILTLESMGRPKGNDIETHKWVKAALERK